MNELETDMIRRNAADAARFVTLAVALLGAAASGSAYLDAGSGSYILQMTVGALLGAAVAVKVFWRRVSAFVVGKLSRKR